MAMGRSSAGVLVFAVAVCAAVQVAMAAQYTVGGSTGWNFAPSPNFYNDWASKNKFAVGDTLVFQYMPAAHNVLEVNSADYSSCSVNNPIQAYGAGNDVVSLTKAGTSYFICGYLGHCSGYGMLMKVVVGGAASPTTPPPTSAPPPAPVAVLPPPPKVTPPPATPATPPLAPATPPPSPATPPPAPATPLPAPAIPPPAPATPPSAPPPKLSPPPATIPPHTKAPAGSPKLPPAPAPSGPTPTSGAGTPVGVNAPAPAPGAPGSPGSTAPSSGEGLRVGVSFLVATILVACAALLV